LRVILGSRARRSIDRSDAGGVHVVAQAEAEGTAPGENEAPAARPGRLGFAIGLLGVAIYVGGTFLAFYGRSQPGSQSGPLRSAYSTFVGTFYDPALAAALGTLLYGAATVIVLLCIGGLLARRPLRWAIATSAAAAAWVIHAPGWMNNMNYDSAGRFGILHHPIGYQAMTLGALIALVGGLIAYRASRSSEASRTAVSLGARSGSWRARVSRTGLLIGIAGAGVYLLSTFLPYGGPGFLPLPRLSVAQTNIGFGGPFGNWPVSNQVAAAITLWGAALVVLWVCAKGLKERDANPWALGLIAAAVVWVSRTVAELVVAYTDPFSEPHIGYRGIHTGIVMALAGGVIGLAGGLFRGASMPASVFPVGADRNEHQVPERTAPRARRRWVGVVLAAPVVIVVAVALLAPGWPPVEVPPGGPHAGPLGPVDTSSTIHGAIAPPGQPVSFGMLTFRDKQLSVRAVLESIHATSVPPGLRVLGFRVIERNIGSSIDTVNRFPPPGYVVHLVAGYAFKGGSKEVQIIVGLEAMKPGALTFPQFVLRYRVGSSQYVATYQVGATICTRPGLASAC
jgi:hypothetical protein